VSQDEERYIWYYKAIGPLIYEHHNDTCTIGTTIVHSFFSNNHRQPPSRPFDFVEEFPESSVCN
jgi:hypothetical protein